MQPQALSTTMALLDGLLEPGNEAVWREFDARYRPIVFAFARKLGLDESDAADVAQEAMLRFVQEYRAGKYDRERGRLRSWIIGIVKYRVADVQRSKAKRREYRGESAFVGLPEDDQLAELWEAERRRMLLRQALAELREQTKTNEKTIRAFELYAIHEQPVADVACELGLTTHDVYVAKSNVAARLREILTRLEQVFDDG